MALRRVDVGHRPARALRQRPRRAARRRRAGEPGPARHRRGADMPVLDAFDLTGRTAVVTGGNRGLGRAFATALGEAGAAVALLARDTAASDAVVEDLRQRGIRAAAFRADVVRRTEV